MSSLMTRDLRRFEGIRARLLLSWPGVHEHLTVRRGNFSGTAWPFLWDAAPDFSEWKLRRQAEAIKPREAGQPSEFGRNSRRVDFSSAARLP
jgi:hypothetical protein